MLSLKELNPHNFPVDMEITSNLNTLLERMNKVRTAWGKPMTVTSGLRSSADQQRINPKAPRSNHLKGAACDIADADRSLTTWIKAHLPLMEEIGLWFEDFDSTPTWVHFQIFPPKSGNRVFKP